MMKKVTKTLALLILLLGGYRAAVAATDPTLTQPLLGSQGELQVGALSTVTDQPNPFLTIQKTQFIHNLLSLSPDPQSPFMILSDFKASFTLELTLYNQKMEASQQLHTFTLDYSLTQGLLPTSDTRLFLKDIFKLQAKIIAINKNVDWDVTKVLRLDNSLTATRDYVFDCKKPIQGLSLTPDNGSGELIAAWQDPHTGLTAYDLEWAWIDQSAIDDYKKGNELYLPEKIFDNNASRVTLHTLSYPIPLLYDGPGLLFVRVRPVQLTCSGQLIEGEWSWQNNGNPVFYSFSGHENNLNWQASTSFAEEGKRKSVVQYFDGTLRNRQSLTKDNSTQTTVVAESFYDYQGRLVVQVLPSPTLNHMISYAQGFNRALNYNGYPKELYDGLKLNQDNCSNPAPPLDNQYGTAQYYSANNEKAADPTSPERFLPDAKGIPFSETRYGPDGTVVAQSGVGPDHRLGSSHETRYFQEAPAQQELDALLGTDAGYAAHYTKNLVKDPNGQYSVSYTDMKGRTVATALAGPAPDNLQPLPSFNTKNFTKQLLDDQNNQVIGNSIVSTRALVVPRAGLYKFHYTLNPEQLSLLNCNQQKICYDCLYNLTITLTAECKNIPGFEKPLVVTDSNFTLNGQWDNPLCNANGKTKGFFDKNFELQLPEGAYTLTKTLALSDSAKKAYQQLFMAQNTCKSLLDFYNTEYQLLVQKSSCALSCESCKASIGADFKAFVQKFIAQSGMTEPLPVDISTQLEAAYQEALDNCNQLCQQGTDKGMEAVGSIRQLMLLDMTPPFGQYAKPEQANTNEFNILGPAGDERYRNPLSYTVGNNPLPAEYRNEWGANEVPSPGKLSTTDFVSQFKTSWAEQLLPYHPEFCKLKASLEQLPSAYQFEATLQHTATWAQASAAGYLNTVNNTINIINKDPFFSGVGSVYKKAMIDKMAVYAVLKTKANCPAQPPMAVSMWQLAQSTVFCRNLSAAGCAQSPQQQCLQSTPKLPLLTDLMECSADWDMTWQNFRSLYLTERKKMISTYLNSEAVCNLKDDQTITQQGNQRRFIDFNNVANDPADDELGKLFEQLAQGDPNAVNTANQMATAQYDSACRGYADSWITQLQQCPSVGTLNAQDSAWLVSRLVAICKGGADQNHFLGASSLPPGTPPINDNGKLYTQFPDVIQVFLQNKNIPLDALCHPYLINSPAPYDKQPALTLQAVITKPDSCQCQRLDTLQTLYKQSAFGGSLSEYLLQIHGTTISQGALDTLSAMCKGTYKCIFLPQPLMLPSLLQCATPLTTCIDCQQYAKLKNDFEASFQQKGPVADPQTDADLQLNKAFEQFANYQTGFHKTWTEYLEFEQQCLGTNTLAVRLKIFLGGAYGNQDNPALMRDDLRKYELIPLTDPYFTDPLLVTRYTPTGSHKISQINKNVLVDKGDQSVVDWVWLQLHDAIDTCKIIATQSALVQKDGFVISPDGSSGVHFPGVPDGQYFISVRHRNHLGVMTQTPVALSKGNAPFIDFTDVNTPVYGSNAQKVINNKAMLWPCDGNANGNVRFNGLYNDKDYLLENCLGGDGVNVLMMVYNNGDYNMNGLVNYNGVGNDKDWLLSITLNNNADASIAEQLPCKQDFKYKTGYLSLKMLLAGAYDSQTGLMRDDLRKLSLLPTSDPYFSDPLLITQYQPAPYHHATQVNAYMFSDFFNQSIKEKAVVDWVWVQLHDAKDSCNIVATQSAFVQRNGQVIATNGSAMLAFPFTAGGHYYVSIRHRNHLGAMTKIPVSLNGGVDFTDINTATFGSNAQKIYPNNVKALWGGNANANKLVLYNGISNDREYILQALNGQPNAFLNNIYHNCDVNMNGIVSYEFVDNDRQAILNMLDNNVFGSRIEQIPACAAPLQQPIIACSELDDIITQYKNQYLQPLSGYVDLDMRTFAGNLTPNEGPKGVFDINKNFIANTVSGTPQEIKASFVQIWNTSPVNQQVGTLSLLPNQRLRLTLQPGQQTPCNGIIGMRYYQFDAPVDTLDAIITNLGSYIDFGDGQSVSVESAYKSYNTTVAMYHASAHQTYYPFFYVSHVYPQNNNKVVTVYHTDTLGIVGFDNYLDPKNAFKLPKLKNLKGYAPKHFISLHFHSTQDSSINTLDGFVNKNEMTGLEFVHLMSGDNGKTVFKNYNFGNLQKYHSLKYFIMDNNQNSPVDLSTILPNIAANFPNLSVIKFSGLKIPNTIDLSLQNLISVVMWNLNSTAQVDLTLNQIASNTTNDSGLVWFVNSPIRSAASDASVQLLKDNKWSIYTANETINPNLWQTLAKDTAYNLYSIYPLTNAFTDFYNQQNGTHYSYHQLADLLKNQCGYQLDVCNPKSNSSHPMLCGLSETVFKPVDYKEDPCSDLPKMAYTAAEEKWQLYQDSLLNVFDSAYINKCLQAKNMESFTLNYNNSEYHYTLYYYDQAGNLVKTVPPQGVDAKHSDAAFLAKVQQARLNVKKGQSEAANIVVPSHSMATQYRYNTLNQPLAQQSPDGGLARFWYDQLGRLTASQNAQQFIDKKYSYTLYDSLGRITEVGQMPHNEAPPADFPEGLEKWLATGGLREQITRTRYDLSYYGGDNLLDKYIVQRNLRGRVSYTMTLEQDAEEKDLGKHHSATYYSYDAHGNVDTLLQDFNFGVMKASGNKYKKLVYDYDLISGKVNRVAYQPGWQDEFYQRYDYDAENRLTDVYTSKDSLTWERDSRYSYYRHGPLARQIIGHNQVQGMDYAYTLQGWLKGVNATEVGSGKYDMGADGVKQGNMVNQVARDAFGFSLHYYGNDYTPINNTVKPFAAIPNITGLYNGNIAAMAINLPKVGEPLYYRYHYDQLNRLTNMDAFKGLNTQTNSWTPIALDDYQEALSYDANGNILTYKRNGSAGKTAMDNMSYQYDAGTNKLNHVKDAVPKDNYSDDIDDQQAGNYKYDAIGNLISDSAENIKNIRWNVYGKIAAIEKKNGDEITYNYDAAGNRIAETLSTGGEGKGEVIYIRDASGNMISTYTVNDTTNNGNLTQSDIELYGSSRLGIDQLNLDVQNLKQATVESRAKKYGSKRFELTEHRGNVMAVISENKTPIDDNNDGLVDGYTPQILQATDYYSFGLEKPGRTFNPGSYHYSYNGKKDDKKAARGYQNYGLREFDKLTSRFISSDPLTQKFPELTPYQFASNTPIQAVDLDGAESMFGWSIGITPKQANDVVNGWQDSHNKITNGTASGIKKSVIKTWGFITSDAWKASTWKNALGFVEEAIFDMSTVKVAPSPNIDAKAKDFKDKVVNGDAYTRSEYFSEVATDLLLAKGIDKAFTVTKGMIIAEKIAVRTNFARSFYEQAGFNSTKTLEHIRGIDFTKVVQTTTLKKGSVIQQWVGENGVGNYFTSLENGTAKNLGISYEGRTLRQFTLTEDIKVLQSTAADFNGHAGGGTQYFSTELKNKITEIKKP